MSIHLHCIFRDQKSVQLKTNAYLARISHADGYTRQQWKKVLRLLPNTGRTILLKPQNGDDECGNSPF